MAWHVGLWGQSLRSVAAISSFYGSKIFVDAQLQ